MSENINNLNLNDSEVKIPMYDIEAPELNNDYANELSNVFNNINSNFIQLANRDFVKGEQGTSIMIEEIYFSTESELYNALKTCIEEGNEDSANKTISYTDENDTEQTLSLWDNFINNPGTLKMIYTIDENNNKEYVSSLYYVFLDGRFANTHIGNIDPTEYTNINDLSCIVVYDKNGFKKLSNAFPTIYYEREVGLCWKLNGVGTGIPVKGIPGKNGENGKLYIVKSGDSFSIDNPSVEVTHVYDNSYISVNEFLQITDIETNIKYPAIILCPNPDTTINGNLFYFGTIEVVQENDSKKIIAYSDYTNAINTYIDYENIINYFKNIDITNTKGLGLPGIFIPLESEKDNETSKIQKAHLLSASSITNNPGDNTLKSDIVLTPVSDINSVINTDNNTNILVNKYLYIKVDENQLDLLINEEKYLNDIKNELNNLNYILKYKLSKIVKYKTEENFKYTYNNSYSNNASMFMYYTDNNIKFRKKIEGDNNFTEISLDNHYNTMPIEFEERLSDEHTSPNYKTGIYRWELCIKKDENIDPEDFKESEFYNSNDNDDTSKYDNDDGSLKSSNLKPFNVIFTLTMSPSISDKFMWFNGLTKTNSDSDSNIYIQGWDYDNIDLLKFSKFIPIYKNDFKIEDDTLLNINYNVNITGDDNNSKKNLTVHGSINCEDFKAYNIAAASEFKNIYTKDEIIGESGLKLSKIDDEYINEINSNGIKTSNIDSNNIIFEKISNKDNTIIVDSKNYNFNNDKSNLINDIKFTNIKNFLLEGSNDIYNFIKNKSDISNYSDANDIINKISTVSANNNAIISNSNSPIIISNTDIKSQQLCVSGIPENYYIEGKIHPAGTFTKTDNTITNTINKSIFLDNSSESNNSSSKKHICDVCKYIYDEETGDPEGGIIPGTEFENLPNDWKCPVCAAGIDNFNEYKYKESNSTNNLSNFDKVKNFNIHRLSLNGVNEKNKEKTIKPLVSNLLDNKKSESYKFGRPFLFKNIYGKTLNDWWNIYDNISYNDINKINYIHKFIVKKINNTDTLISGTNIEIDLTSIYNIIIGIYGRTAGLLKRNPVLSKFELKLNIAYKKHDNTWETLSSSSIQYNLNSNKIEFNQNNCYNTDNSNDIYTLTTNNTNNSGSWRYKSFKFKGKKININVTQDIINSYNDRKLEFIVYPTIKAEISTDKGNKQTHLGFMVTMPVPISDSVTIINNSNSIINCNSHVGEYSNNNCKLTYNYIEENGNSNIINSSTITDDGIIFRSGDYTFGLGYSKNFDTTIKDESEPILFYHKYNTTDYCKDTNDIIYPNLNNDETIEYSYAKRTQAIPLKDLFTAINIIKDEYKTKWAEYSK